MADINFSSVNVAAAESNVMNKVVAAETRSKDDDSDDDHKDSHKEDHKNKVTRETIPPAVVSPTPFTPASPSAVSPTPLTPASPSAASPTPLTPASPTEALPATSASPSTNASSLPGTAPGASPPPLVTVQTLPLIAAASGSPSPSTQGKVNGLAASEVSTKYGANTKSGGSGTAIVVAVAVIICLGVIAIAVFVVRRRKAKSDEIIKSLSTSGGCSRVDSGSDSATSHYNHVPHTNGAVVDMRCQSAMAPSSSTSFADHPDIMAVRIPLEKIEFHELLSRGGFGEVHRGTYSGKQVAIKRLLPERRKDPRQIDAFLSEAKMMGTLEHEHIVQFIGVAWGSLSELCVVTEFMEGGDLRSVLIKWRDDPTRGLGFDRDKIKIAVHVANAMCYLHSLQPNILHRDLKSKNILLTPDLDAKLTDFGVSRERIDATMTAGVGTSLWMAPEVMMGKRYDEKADVFSFGAVLSELDTLRLPYANVKEPGSGRKLPESVILQMVALGKIEVEFTRNADPEMVALGRDCVAMDPKKRPTAGEAFHRMHQLWRNRVSL